MHSENRKQFIALTVVCLLAAAALGCFGPPKPPDRPDNVCEIFREHEDWYDDAHDSYRRWGIPIPVLMAIMHQESRFHGDIKPPRTTCLWVFPGPRPSSAYGYSQALDPTWESYKRATGRSGADRDDFGDAIDFIGWYCNLSHTRCGIPKNDAYRLYLAYHEGQGGYSRGTYRNKGWLLNVAAKVKKRSDIYHGQLAACEREFLRKGCCLWPF